MTFKKPLIGIILSTILLSCLNESSVDTESDSSNLKYFGFTLIDTYWDDPTDSTNKINYLDEVSSFSNMADILIINPNDNVSDRIQIMHNVGVKSILHLSEIFFERIDVTSPSGNDYDLRQDYKTRWDEFVNTNSLSSIQEMVQALYIGEEPTWNGISFDELKLAADYIKQKSITIPIMIIEAYPAINQLEIPNSVDWIGFDHYFIQDPTQDTNYQFELNKLKSKFSNPDQQLVVVMDAHFISNLHGNLGGFNLDDMETVANNYFTLAKNEPLAIAILAYFWPSGFEDSTAIGARNMPDQVRQNYMRIGKEITKK